MKTLDDLLTEIDKEIGLAMESCPTDDGVEALMSAQGLIAALKKCREQKRVHLKSLEEWGVDCVTIAEMRREEDQELAQILEGE